MDGKRCAGSPTPYIRQSSRPLCRRVRHDVAAWLIVAAGILAVTMPGSSAVAADLPAAPSASATDIAKPGNLRRALTVVMRIARWMRWWGWAQDLADAIQDLLAILEDSKRAAEALRKIEALEARIATLERELTARPAASPHAQVMRKSLRALQAELAASRRAYQTCPEGQHRVGTRCNDKRLSTAPTTK